MDAVLDALLSNHCHSGKVFVGQKLRVIHMYLIFIHFDMEKLG